MSGVREAQFRPSQQDLNHLDDEERRLLGQLTDERTEGPEVISSGRPIKRASGTPASAVEEEELTEATATETEAETRERGSHRNFSVSKGYLFATILVSLFIALLSAVTTDSGLVYALIGFSPAIVSSLVYLGLLEGNYKDVLFWLTPLAVCMGFFLFGGLLNELLGNQLDVPVLTGINMMLAYLYLGILALIDYHTKEELPLEELEEFKPEKLDQYIHTIEDKCKAINFVIGRVYRASHGGTKDLRGKIKVPPEWYNEFNAIRPEEVADQKAFALDLLHRIQDQLSTLLRPEKDVFSEKEVKSLKHLARDKEGKDRILDVLSVNDQDPVEDYYLGAMDFCKRINKHLEDI